MKRVRKDSQGPKRQQVFSIQKWDQLATTSGYAALNEEVENIRCEGDLMYKLLGRPHLVIDNLLPDLLKLIKRKNAPDSTRSRVLREAVHILTLPETRVNTKIFFTLLILNQDQDAREVIQAGLLAPGSQEKFAKFLPRFSEIVHRLFSSRFGKATIVKDVDGVVMEARYLYFSL